MDKNDLNRPDSQRHVWIQFTSPEEDCRFNTNETSLNIFSFWNCLQLSDKYIFRTKLMEV